MRVSPTRRAALNVFLIVLGVYLFPLAYNLAHKPFFTILPGIDIVSTSLLPIGILTRGDFFLDEYQSFFGREFVSPGFVYQVSNHLVSRSPVSAAVFALPFYGIPLGTGWIFNPPPHWLTYPSSAFVVARFSATVMTALAVVMFFFCARELTTLRHSVLLAIVFAFATSIWSTNSSGLWQHTPSVLLQCIALWFLLRGRRRGALASAPAAFFFSAATVARTNVAIAALVFTAFVLLQYRAVFVRWILWAIPPALFFFGYNTIYNGSPLSFGTQEGVAQYVTLPNPEAIVGLLVSPSRGWLIFSPFVLFAFFGWLWSRKERDWLFYSCAALVVVIGILAISMFTVWDSGWGYGTRYMTDLTPYALLLLVPIFAQMQQTRWRVAFWAMVTYGIVLQSFGLWDYGVRWHWSWDKYAYDVWSIERSEPLFYLREYLGMASQYIQKYLIRP